MLSRGKKIERRKGGLKETKSMFNATAIIRMVIMTVGTRIATVDIDDRKDREEKNWDNEHYDGEE